jgi:hypothetical protein
MSGLCASDLSRTASDLSHTAFTRHSGVNRYWLMDNGVITVRTRTIIATARKSEASYKCTTRSIEMAVSHIMNRGSPFRDFYYSIFLYIG